MEVGSLFYMVSVSVSTMLQCQNLVAVGFHLPWYHAISKISRPKTKVSSCCCFICQPWHQGFRNRDPRALQSFAVPQTCWALLNPDIWNWHVLMAHVGKLSWQWPHGNSIAKRLNVYQTGIDTSWTEWATLWWCYWHWQYFFIPTHLWNPQWKVASNKLQ